MINLNTKNRYSWSKLIAYDGYNKTFKEHIYNYIDDYVRVLYRKRQTLYNQANYRGLITKAHYDFNDTETVDERTSGSAYKCLSDYKDARIMVQSDTAGAQY